MKKTAVIVICISVILILAIGIALLLINSKQYTDEFSSEELYLKVENSFSTDGDIIIVDDDVILEFSEDEIAYLKDYTVVKAKNAKNVNEIGIFKVDRDSAKDMKALVDKYISNLQQSYRAMDYFPEEVEKIDCATVRIFGSYVVYSFLNENDTEAFYDAIESTLTK